MVQGFSSKASAQALECLFPGLILVAMSGFVVSWLCCIWVVSSYLSTISLFFTLHTLLSIPWPYPYILWAYSHLLPCLNPNLSYMKGVFHLSRCSVFHAITDAALPLDIIKRAKTCCSQHHPHGRCVIKDVINSKDIVNSQYLCQFLFLEHVNSKVWAEVLQQQYV